MNRVQLIAISIDDARSTTRVSPKCSRMGLYGSSRSNGDYKRAMNVNNVPLFWLMGVEK